jgi:hypothetical protein
VEYLYEISTQRDGRWAVVRTRNSGNRPYSIVGLYWDKDAALRRAADLQAKQAQVAYDDQPVIAQTPAEWMEAVS